MKSITTKDDSSQPVADAAVYLFDDWFDPIEATVRIARSSARPAGSMPRYRTVLSILVWPSNSWTARRYNTNPHDG